VKFTGAAPFCPSENRARHFTFYSRPHSAKNVELHIFCRARVALGPFQAAALTMAGKEEIFDSRSSDAIALAIHFKAPILVTRQLLDSNGVELEAAAET
jgi:hypothetical protein